jgi:hypothetical protein
VSVCLAAFDFSLTFFFFFLQTHNRMANSDLLHRRSFLVVCDLHDDALHSEDAAGVQGVHVRRQRQQGQLEDQNMGSFGEM